MDEKYIADKIAFKKKMIAIRQQAFAGKDMTIELNRGSYQARSIKAVLDVVLPLLDEAMIDVNCIEIKPVHSGETHFKAVFVYEWTDLETGYSEISQTAGSGLDPGDKDTGKAITYAFKYLFTTRFAMDSGEDTDKVSSEVMISKTLEDLKKTMVTLGEKGYFLSEAVNRGVTEEEKNLIAKEAFNALGSDIANHKHNAAWLTTKKNELENILKRYGSGR